MNSVSNSNEADCAPSTSGGLSNGPAAGLLGIGFVVALSAAARLWYGLSKSLVLDEFHSYFHATNGPIGAFFTKVLEDNHPPLSFALIAASTKAFGTGALALRLPALVCGLVEIVLVAGLASRVARCGTAVLDENAGRVRRPNVARTTALLAALMVATSAMHFDYGTQARMYALLAVAITLAMSGIIELVGVDAPRRRAALALFAGALVAFHTHYFALQYLAVLACAAVCGAACAGESARVKRLFLPLGAAGLLSLPWAIFGLRVQLGHDLPPGGDDLGLSGLAQAYVHLFAHNVAFGGQVGRWVFVGIAGLALLLGFIGALSLLRCRRTRAAGTVLAAVAFAVPLASWAAASIIPRAGFTWHYVLPSVAAAATLVPFGTRAIGRAGVVLGAIAVCGGAALCALHIANPATEDFRGAVAHALNAKASAENERIGEQVQLVSVEWQPALFPQGQPFDYYAPRLWSRSDVPSRAKMMTREFFPLDFKSVEQADRVIVVSRSLPSDQPLLRRLQERFGEPLRTNFGYGVDVLEFPSRGALSRE